MNLEKNTKMNNIQLNTPEEIDKFLDEVKSIDFSFAIMAIRNWSKQQSERLLSMIKNCKNKS